MATNSTPNKAITHVRPFASRTKSEAPITLSNPKANAVLHSNKGCAVRIVNNPNTLTVAVVVDHRDDKGLWQDILIPATYSTGRPYTTHVVVRDGKQEGRPVQYMLSDTDMTALKKLIGKYL